MSRVVYIDTDPSIAMIVDAEDEQVFNHLPTSYVRTRRCYYATIDINIFGKVRRKRVHRIVARTPPHEVCHHRNRNSLDNRRNNLLNMNPIHHDHLHKNNNCLVKYDNNSTGVHTKNAL